ncbi:MAG TPA: methylenetetrahydrofolate--tRNA-(uracil(54)-C(5))-methyltransferase (FADH(2)-oxidizing) TrmFO [Terriglobia bacterium]|nr:methylenetetrahydrofolate--tRNA-(uracil(54)-C(5))-methyltransferase (FADH(2)-oxidizing) TrmFO [Terriglobia bacterium]
MPTESIIIIGGGLAGSEAAWQIARLGLKVRLFEMRPDRMTPAHKTGHLAEIVCSNSFKSEREFTAPWLLKQELIQLDSLLIRLAYENRVPSGASLSVDRAYFAAEVTEALEKCPGIEICREEVTTIPQNNICIIATGPLTSEKLSQSIRTFAGEEHLYFYDAISPVVDAETIDMARVFRASRYDKAGADYLNCPMTKDEYLAFYDALIHAESVPLHECEKAMYFESCLPIEEMARRGLDTLRFGPMKPVGLMDPRSKKMPYAAVQLRQETLKADSYNLVGLQNHLRFGEQERVFRLIPGLEQALFLRLGQIHRNTYVNSPRLLMPTLQTRKNLRVFFAGQISGVEGYVECIATGLVAGINASRLAMGLGPVFPPRRTAIGSLLHYLANADPDNFQPENINFGIMPPLEFDTINQRKLAKMDRHRLQVQQALAGMAAFSVAVHSGMVGYDIKPNDH